VNRLSKETSPYLLQHAHNPVDWYPWGEEALSKAVKEDKPILVSIGYAACHWCHVMEKESFENTDTAAVMNEHFVNIKIDREERPDLDHIYMDAVQAIQGQGGWPLNVFLTPTRKPFFGGTYFPPQRAFNRSSWPEILAAVVESFKVRRNEIESQAENLTNHLEESNNILQSIRTKELPHFSKEQVKEIFDGLMKAADTHEGGFGKAPKFPQTFSIAFLLGYHFQENDALALQHACLSIDKMINGGIYDQLGGGFARYSTDAGWLAPHFEKMLYDNALLVMVLCDAYAITGNEIYKKKIIETIGFVERELTSPEGGFYSALDADSEGVEGKFYVWSREEIDRILGDEAELFCEYFDVTSTGNWEQTNILRVKEPHKEFADRKRMNEEELKEKLQIAADKLLYVRNKRVRPLLDDKILLSWNALMITACAKAFAATGIRSFRDSAEKNASFLWENLFSNGNWKHTYKKSEAKYPAFLDDHAYLIQALLHLQEISGDTSYLEKAKVLTEEVCCNFSDEENVFFYFTRTDQLDVIVRKKELYDGATPSGNAIMAWNLYYLGIVFNTEKWVDRAFKMAAAMQQVIIKYPTSFGVWTTIMQGLAYGIPEIVLAGKDIRNLHSDLLRTFIPFKIFQSTTLPNQTFPLLENKLLTEESRLYFCKQYACQSPVNEVTRLIQMIKKG